MVPSSAHASHRSSARQVEFGIFGDPTRATRQGGELLYGWCELAGVGHAGEAVVSVPSFECVSHWTILQIRAMPALCGQE